MLNPDSVAFVGANNQPTTMGTVQMLQTLNFGYNGRIYPVHPKAESILGYKCYGSILDIPEPVDLAIICIRAAAASTGYRG